MDGETLQSEPPVFQRCGVDLRITRVFSPTPFSFCYLSFGASSLNSFSILEKRKKRNTNANASQLNVICSLIGAPCDGAEM